MVNCHCIKGRYNFEVLASDRKNIIYQDLSEWMAGDHYLLPDTYNLQIIPPGKKSPGAMVQATVGVSVRFTSEQLGFELEDGVYCFRVESCGVTYTRYKGIFPEIDCCLTKARVLLWETKREQIEDILEMLDSLKVKIELQDLTGAEDVLRIIKIKLYNLKCDCSGCK